MVVVVGVKLTAICLRAVDRRVAAAATIFKMTTAGSGRRRVLGAKTVGAGGRDAERRANDDRDEDDDGEDGEEDPDQWGHLQRHRTLPHVTTHAWTQCC